MDAVMESGILTMSPLHAELPLKLAMKRGFLGRCPNCGKTPLFKSYLKQVDTCSNCGAEFGRIRADDAAPWLTIIVVGHIFLPLAFMLDLSVLPVWVEVTGWSLFFAGLSAVLLPRAKGVMLAILWQTRATAEPTIVT